ncbi:MAG: pyrroline-5-carboxylate reductase [Clostridia bacterium]|nr:pyrroline-5-carboxylate reductase [Clostridia bacterium]
MKIGFIGTGNMGGALALAAAKAEGNHSLFLADFDKKKAAELAERLGASVSENREILETCDMVFLGVKPQVLPALLEEIAPTVKKRGDGLVLISMAAGVSTARILSFLGEKTPLIRMMPNTPVSVGEGVIVYHSVNVDAAREASFLSLMKRAGLVEKLSEDKIDAASALHGCGPAFVYLFVEALADGAVACGLSRDTAQRFAAATVAGAAKTVLETKKHPGELKDAVCSPGGSTIEGVRVLEEAAFRSAAMDAVIAAFEKTKSLGK